MDQQIKQTLTALLARHGLQPRERDLEAFGPLIEQYMASLKALHSVDVDDEEMALIFLPQSTPK
jgi:hypothetical protein